MRVEFRSGGETGSARIEQVRHVNEACDIPFAYEPRVEAPDLTERISMRQLGLLHVTSVARTPARVNRPTRLIRRSDPELCKIDVAVSGDIRVAQGDNRARLRPGDITFVDLSRPCTLETASNSELVAVVFPRSLLPLRADELAELAAVRMTGTEGAGALLSSFARDLPRHIGDDEATDGRLGTAIVDLIGAVLAARLDRSARVPADAARRVQLHRIQAFIEQRLGDPNLTPAAIARAHHISTRHLYNLFATADTSVSGWIRHRRLERCRQDLLDPRLANRTASAIAARWGLTSPSHFTRLFKRAYDTPPSEYRVRQTEF